MPGGQFFSLISEAEEGGETQLTDFFKKSSKKEAPAYDYTEVDNQKSKAQSSQDDKDDDDLSDLGDVEEEDEAAQTQEKKVIAANNRTAQVEHEDTKTRQADEEKDKRTVFVGNLSVETKKQKLKQLFSQHGKVETVRFRCASRPDMKTTKKVAVIKQKFHEERNNICAYVRMTTVEEAEAACGLNGSNVDGFTIRVDLSLKNKSHDNKKSIFLGNLHFKTKEEDVRRLFSKCGDIENVRLIRDATTGMGKGFGYVNFSSEESVQLAVRLNQQEVEGRKVRVSRAVRKPKPGFKKISGKAPGKVTGKAGGDGSKKKSWNESKRKEFKVNKKRGNNIERKTISDKKGKENNKGRKTESRGFQGVKSSANKKSFKKVTKTDRMKKAMAAKLSS